MFLDIKVLIDHLEFCGMCLLIYVLNMSLFVVLLKDLTFEFITKEMLGQVFKESE
jgi:hypothetical protein